jgi:hypothetical protein
MNSLTLSFKICFLVAFHMKSHMANVTLMISFPFRFPFLPIFCLCIISFRFLSSLVISISFHTESQNRDQRNVGILEKIAHALLTNATTTNSNSSARSELEQQYVLEYIWMGWIVGIIEGSTNSVYVCCPVKQIANLVPACCFPLITLSNAIAILFHHHPPPHHHHY